MTPLEKLKLITAWETEPALTEDEVEDLLESAGIADADGFGPNDEEWTPTYDLNKAAADAWLIKAARAAATFEVDPPESGIVTSKVFDNCRRMASIYIGKRVFTISTSDPKTSATKKLMITVSQTMRTDLRSSGRGRYYRLRAALDSRSTSSSASGGTPISTTATRPTMD